VTRIEQRGELKVYVAIDGPRVRALREQRGMARRELAKAAGLGAATVANLERSANVRLRTARKVGAVFGLHPREFGRPAREKRGEA
jgi:transcriptional regulator with XRE-family HTH domain